MSGFYSAGLFDVIPDSVTSRPDDDESESSFSESQGLAIVSSKSFSGTKARISSQTSGVTRARVYDYGQSEYIASTDISGLSSGDVFQIDFDFQSGVDYGIELDAEGGDYTAGFNRDERDYPYTGTDIDIIARSRNGTQIDDGTSSSGVSSVNDIGNPQ